MKTENIFVKLNKYCFNNCKHCKKKVHRK